MKSVGSFLRLIPQLERRRDSAGAAAATVAPYDLLALKAKDTQLLIMLPALNRQTKKLRASFVPSNPPVQLVVARDYRRIVSAGFC